MCEFYEASAPIAASAETAAVAVAGLEAETATLLQCSHGGHSLAV